MAEPQFPLLSDQDEVIARAMHGADDALLPTLDGQSQASLISSAIGGEIPRTIAKPLTFDDVFDDPTKRSRADALNAFNLLDKIGEVDPDYASRMKNQILEMQQYRKNLQGYDYAITGKHLEETIKSVEGQFDKYGLKMWEPKKQQRIVDEQTLMEMAAKGMRVNAVVTDKPGLYAIEDISASAPSGGVEFTTKNPDGTETTVRMGGSGGVGGGRKENAAEAAKRNTTRRSPIYLRNAALAIKGVKETEDNDSTVNRALRTISSLVPAGITDASRTQQYVDFLTGSGGFQYLKDMRAESPTGGAVGNVSDYENKIMKLANSGVLDPALRKDQRIAGIRQLIKLNVDAVYGSDDDLDAALKEGKITPEQARQSKIERDNAYIEAASGNEKPFMPPDPEEMRKRAQAETRNQIQSIDPSQLENMNLDEIITVLEKYKRELEQ